MHRDKLDAMRALMRQAKAEAARLARKRKHVDQSELTWLQTHLKAGKDAPAAAGAPGRGRMQAIADTIIGNLQFSITNVHIRYEVQLTLLLSHSIASAYADCPRSATHWPAAVPCMGQGP